MGSKPCLVFVNLLFLVFSLVLLIIGVITQLSLDSNYRIFQEHLVIPISVILAFGTFLFVTALLALLSVFCRSNLLLSIYVCALGVLIITELAVVIAGFVTKSRVLTIISNILRSAESTYSSNSLVNTSWDSVQHDFKCCGVNSYKEWFVYLNNSSVPDSCCVVYTVGCGSVAALKENIYQSSCAPVLSEWADTQEITVAILYSSMVTLQLLCLLCLKQYAEVPQRYDTMSDDL